MVRTCGAVAPPQPVAEGRPDQRARRGPDPERARTTAPRSRPAPPRRPERRRGDEDRQEGRGLGRRKDHHDQREPVWFRSMKAMISAAKASMGPPFGAPSGPAPRRRQGGAQAITGPQLQVDRLGGVAALGDGGDGQVLAPRRAVAADPDLAGRSGDLAACKRQARRGPGQGLADGLEDLVGLQREGLGREGQALRAFGGIGEFHASALPLPMTRTGAALWMMRTPAWAACSCS
jgi:hypothetical protein